MTGTLRGVSNKHCLLSFFSFYLPEESNVWCQIVCTSLCFWMFNEVSGQTEWMPGLILVIEGHISLFLSQYGTVCCMLFQEKLVAVLFGMLRLHKFEFLDVYREETFTGMKAIVKQV